MGRVDTHKSGLGKQSSILIVSRGAVQRAELAGIVGLAAKSNWVRKIKLGASVFPWKRCNAVSVPHFTVAYTRIELLYYFICDTNIVALV